jgi:hypothetical protein
MKISMVQIHPSPIIELLNKSKGLGRVALAYVRELEYKVLSNERIRD